MGQFDKNLSDKKRDNDELYDLGNETDGNKIIAALLLDKNLMRDNEDMNRLLANEDGVKKDVRYKLLQLENPTSKQNRKRNKNKNKSDNYYINGNLKNPNNEENRGKRIEDKLLEYGKALKQKKAQERVNKLKAEDEECTFKPKIKKKKVWLKPYENKDFYARAAQFEERKGKEIDKIKNKLVDPNLKELTFKPKISKFSKNIKRNINDLYNWQNEKQRKLEKRQKDKKKKQDEEIALNQQTIFTNNKSKILSSNRKSPASSKNYNDLNNFGNTIINSNNMNMNNMNINMDMNMNENDEMNENIEAPFDLWPNYLERKFCDEKEGIHLPDSNESNKEYNHLDFIENKTEIKNDQSKTENEEEDEDEFNE